MMIDNSNANQSSSSQQQQYLSAPASSSMRMSSNINPLQQQQHPLQQHPQQPPIIPMKPNFSSLSSQQSANNNNNNPNSILPRTKVPEIPTSFPFLDGLSIQELEDLLSDSQHIKDIIAEHELIVELDNKCKEVMMKIKETTDKNNEKKQELLQLDSSLQTITSNLRQSQTINNSLSNRQQKFYQKFSLQNYISLLDQQIQQMEEQSDQTREKYENLNQKIISANNNTNTNLSSSSLSSSDDQGLLEQYIKERISVHELTAKKEIILNNHMNSNTVRQ